MGKTALTIVALLALTSGSYAKELSSVISPAWHNSYGEAITRGSAIVREGPNTFDRVVHDQGQCDKGEELTPDWAYSGNSPRFLGYTCENQYD